MKFLVGLFNELPAYVEAEDEKSAVRSIYDLGLTPAWCRAFDPDAEGAWVGRHVDAADVAERLKAERIDYARIEAKRIKQREAYARRRAAERVEQAAEAAKRADDYLYDVPPGGRYREIHLQQRPVEPVAPICEPPECPLPIIPMPAHVGVSHLLRAEVDRRERSYLRGYSSMARHKSRRYEGLA